MYSETITQRLNACFKFVVRNKMYNSRDLCRRPYAFTCYIPSPMYKRETHIKRCSDTLWQIPRPAHVRKSPYPMHTASPHVHSSVRSTKKWYLTSAASACKHTRQQQEISDTCCISTWNYAQIMTECITLNTPPTNRAPFSNWDLWLLITINDFNRNEFKFNIAEYANRNSEAQSAKVKLIVCAIISQPINENGMHAIHIGAELRTRVIDRQFINTALYANCSAYILNILDVMRTKKQF